MFTGNTLLRTMLIGALALTGTMAMAHETPPSPQTSQRYGVFEEPLIATTTPSREESVALKRAIDTYRRAGDAGQTVALKQFLATHPDSPWRASLWLDIGLADRSTGRYSDAIQAFANARQATGFLAAALRPVVLRALSEQLVLETRLGHRQQVAALLQETQRLGAAAEDAATVAIAKEGLWDMQHHPQSAFQCGWIALTALWRAEGLPVGSAPVQRMDPQHPGYNLQQLVDIAAQHHQPMTAIRAMRDAPIPVPSVVHWKSGHFATILAQAHGRYEIADPVIAGKAWWSAAAVRAESSGYYLVPKKASALIADYRPVSSAVAQTVRGAGYTRSSDPHGFPSCGTGKCSCGCGQGSGGSSGGTSGAAGGTGGTTPGGGSTPSPGMPTYSVSPMLISLTLTDTPLSYAPPKGPAMDFTLRYNQLDIDQPATFTYGNLGPKWTDNWLSYVQDDPTAPGNRVMVYLPDGPGRLYSGFNGNNGTFAPETETGAQLVEVSGSPVVYERRFPDGSKDVYAASDNSTYYPRRIFLTERVDAHGDTVKLAYDSQSRLTAVTDALGQAMTFHYDNASQPLLLTGVSDAFGRTASLAYDVSGRLGGITDAMGMTSNVAYDGGTSITALTTPYGTTHFVTGQSGVQRWINITDADGNTSRMEFNEAVPGVPFSESQVPQGINAFNLYINSRDSFYWDAQAYKQYPGDYTKAVIYHWSHLNRGGGLTAVTSDALESIKYPLENRIWYNHPGDIAGGSGALNVPSALGRVLPDGSTQFTQNSYNAQGKLTRSVDPAGLETDYTYAPNQIDVVQIDRRAVGGYHTVETFTYDNQHDVLSHTDETGAVTRHTYDAEGQVLSTTDALGHVTQYAYDANGYLVSKTDANGHATTYSYDAVGRLASETDPLHRTTRYSYDALNRLVHTAYPDGSSDTTTWDKLDKVAYRDRDGHTTHYAYDAMRHLVSETDPLGNTTAYTYYPNGLRETRTDANGHTTTWQRDLEGRVVAVVDPSGATTQTTYDSSDRRSSVINALEQTTTFAYDAQDRLVRTVNPNGVITDDTYTPRGWLATRTVRANANGSPSADDAATTVSYDAAGDVVAITDPDGVKTSYVLDADHRRIATNDAFGNTQLHDYDAVGNLTTQADAAAGSSAPSWLQSYEYDAANQRVATIDAYNRATRVRYDLNGAVRDTRDPRHIHTLTDYDPMDRLLRTVAGRRGDDEHDGDRGNHDGDRDDRDHDGGHNHGEGDGDHDHDVNVAVTRYHYDADGRLIQVTDPDHLATDYAYDPAGQLVRQDSPDTGSTTYAYDVDGNRTRTVDARQVETDRSYDALHRVVAVAYPSNSALNAIYHYDETPSVTGCAVSYPVGHVSRMIDASGTTSYCYGARGNLIAQHRIIAGTAYATSYAYTLGNRLSLLIYPSGVVLNYSHDADGRTSAISVQASGQASAMPLVASVSYLPFGPVNAVVYGDGHQSLQRSYDLNYWGTDITGLGLSLHVRRDGDGNIVTLHQGPKVGPSAEQRYRYDALQRLTHVTGPYGWFGDHYAYNATGDRLAKDSMGSWPTRYDYEPTTHRLSGIGHPGQWHLQPVLSDAAGNIVQMPQAGQTLSLGYGANGRLLQVAKDGRVAGAYVYDANGLRAQKTAGTEVQQFVYDSTDHLLGDYASASLVQREYVWLDGTPVATLDTSTQGTVVHDVGTDFLSTPRSVVDAQGHLVWSWDYADEAFGDSQPLGSYSMPLRFPGQYQDVESGLTQNGFRDYSSSLGRYIESDPRGLRGGVGTYVYVDNRPTLEVDRAGLVGCAGTWIQVGSVMPNLDFLGPIGSLINNSVCRCVWICVKCPNQPWMWSGDPHDPTLPRTTGVPVGMGGDPSMNHEGGGHTIEPSSDRCACEPPHN